MQFTFSNLHSQGTEKIGNYYLLIDILVSRIKFSKFFIKKKKIFGQNRKRNFIRFHMFYILIFCIRDIGI